MQFFYNLEAWLLYFDFLLSCDCLCLFLTVPSVGLQSVIVAFPGHTHLLFAFRNNEGTITKG